MNEIAPQSSTALALPLPADLAVMFRTEGGTDPILDKIRAEVRSLVPDTSTKKGRDAIASMAYKVSRSKTALDEAGKALNEDARKQINVVDAARKKIRDQLDALRDEVRKPLVDWENDETLRLNNLKARMRALDAGRADSSCTSDQIAEVIGEVEATEIGDDWQEYQGQAAIAKDAALTWLRRNLEIARKREHDAAELERLRAEEAARQEEDRKRREAEETAARLAERANNARAYIEQVGKGLIGGQMRPIDILIYELETKLPPLVADLGEHAASVEQFRLDTLAALVATADEKRKQDEARAEEERKAAAEQAKRDAEAEAKRRADEAAEAERQRMADQQRAEEEAQRKREENTRIRNRVRREIVEAFREKAVELTPENIADALIAGQIPNITVRF